ncbi:MAG TPA: DivIVA domain-containing protein [Microbacteriaceae bacterium]|nr:DivIVA domain-containing protein [Microbacteriaceae bacterium]
MALTPEDVVNKRFQPTKFREGYDQDEVDDFLDEVVVELRRLGQENEDLRRQLAAGQPDRPETNDEVSDDEDADNDEPAAAEAPAAPKAASHMAPEEEPVPAATAAPAANEAESANNLLQLAQRLHDEHVKAGQDKRDALIAEGRETAQRLIAEAESEQQEKIATLEGQRTQLEQRVEELRTFERDYRAQLRGYIEGQLRQLDTEKQGGLAPQNPSQARGTDQKTQGGTQQGAFQGFSA